MTQRLRVALLLTMISACTSAPVPAWRITGLYDGDILRPCGSQLRYATDMTDGAMSNYLGKTRAAGVHRDAPCLVVVDTFEAPFWKGPASGTDGKLCIFAVYSVLDARTAACPTEPTALSVVPLP